LENSEWIIVGLGNPGESYRQTRHNLGFMIADLLAERWKAGFFHRRGKSEWARGTFSGSKVLLLKPLTFMNLSGTAVRQWVETPESQSARLLVVYDDLHLPLGKVRLRLRGSAGGHHGVESIIEQLQTKEFLRLRLGIGMENQSKDTADFVLSPFSRPEWETVKEMLQQSAQAIESLIVHGAEKTMSLYNR
jgi:peptidyl-tRNA hydrolase, PTH1 family